MNEKIEEIINWYKDQFKATGWWELFRHIIPSTSFKNVLIKLWDIKEEGIRFTPKVRDVFNNFLSCPYQDLKAIIVCDKPYSDIEWANGIPFDKGKDVNLLYSEIEKDFKIEHRSYTLPKHLSSQGVLFLNRTFTRRIEGKGHYHLWEETFNSIIDFLLNKDLMWIVMGEENKKQLEELLEDEEKVYYTPLPHPNWDSKQIFKKLNSELKINYNA